MHQKVDKLEIYLKTQFSQLSGSNPVRKIRKISADKCIQILHHVYDLGSTNKPYNAQ